MNNRHVRFLNKRRYLSEYINMEEGQTRFICKNWNGENLYLLRNRLDYTVTSFNNGNGGCLSKDPRFMTIREALKWASKQEIF